MEYGGHATTRRSDVPVAFLYRPGGYLRKNATGTSRLRRAAHGPAFQSDQPNLALLGQWAQTAQHLFTPSF
jgi:hypothetical protein